MLWLVWQCSLLIASNPQSCCEQPPWGYDMLQEVEADEGCEILSYDV